MVINTNVEAQATWRNLNVSHKHLAKSLARLSSGSKIVDPADDAAGLAVSARLESQTRRLTSALNNVANAMSYTQTQDGFFKLFDNALSRMGELAMLAQDTTKSNQDRTLYNKEFQQLKEYILQTRTKDFNGVSLFAGTDMAVTVDADGNTFTMPGINLDANTYSAALSQATGKQVETITVTAGDGTGDTFKATVNGQTTAAINSILPVKQVDKLEIAGDASDTFTVTIEGTSVGPITWDTNKATTAGKIATAINDNTTLSGKVVASVTGDDVILTAKTAGVGFTTTKSVSDAGGTAASITKTTPTANKDGNALTAENLRAAINAFTGVSATISGNVITITADTAGTPLTGTTSVERSDTTNSSAVVATVSSNKTDVSIDTVSGAQNAIVLLKDAIDEMTNDRAKLGAIQQRLIFTDEQLRVAREKVNASKSRLVDVDVAEEATNYARYQILVQSGTQMLRQANELPKYALDLLR